MKKIFTLNLAFVFILINASCFSQAGEWTWMSGDNVTNQPGIYGTPLVADTNNKPGGRYEAGNFTDSNNNFWLFGGFGNGCAGCPPGDRLSDLWKYNPLTNEWTFMKGDSVTMQPGYYGTKGIPSPLNKPGYRAAFCTWSETQGCLWLLGGVNPWRNDLWRYNIAANEWTWMTGDSIGQPALPVYGTKGVPDPANTPGGRDEVTCTWIGNDSSLWLFGGRGYDVNGTVGGFLNDLWKYDINSNEWTWMSGDSLANQTAVYGVKGVMSPSNIPGGRWTYCSWKDLSGNLWLFGGIGYGMTGYLNDLWKYDVIANQWTWMNGDNFGALYGGYFSFPCVNDPANSPQHRTEDKARWIDACGNFWMYGGHQGNHCDLWKYNISSNEWVGVNGNTSTCSLVYGTKGVSAPLNTPGGRVGAPSWLGADGSFWMFGDISHRNDLWRFIPDTTCGGCNINTSVKENNFNNVISVYPNPGSESIIISSEFGIEKIEIFNLLGETVFTEKPQTLNFKLQTLNFPNGLYIIKAYTGKGVFQQKLVVQ